MYIISHCNDQIEKDNFADEVSFWGGFTGRSSDYRIIQYPCPKASTLAFRRLAGPSLWIRLPSKPRCSVFSINRRVLKNLRADNRVECLGRGQNAQWRKTNDWQLGNTK